MKKNSIVLLILLSLTSYAQNILNLEDLKGRIKVEKYSLNTKELYGFDKTIEMYNLFIDPTALFLISVLPNFEKEESWKKVDYDRISNQILTEAKLKNITADWIGDNTPDKKTFKYKLLKKIGKDYYMADNCFAEVFSMKSYPFPIISTYGSLNIAESKVSIREMKAAFEKVYPKLEFPVDNTTDPSIQIVDAGYAIRNYVSKEYRIKGDIAYQFWTLDGWWVQDGYNRHRGIDRFVYIPEKGIVGGSYDFYFAHKPNLMVLHDVQLPVSSKILWENSIHEKVMIAEELK